MRGIMGGVLRCASANSINISSLSFELVFLSRNDAHFSANRFNAPSNLFDNFQPCWPPYERNMAAVVLKVLTDEADHVFGFFRKGLSYFIVTGGKIIEHHKSSVS